MPSSRVTTAAAPPADGHDRDRHPAARSLGWPPHRPAPGGPAEPARPGKLPRKRTRKSDSPRNPAGEIRVVSEPLDADVNHALHRAASEIHLPHVWLAQDIWPSLRSDAHHQLVADNAAGHVAAGHETQAAEHPDLAHVGFAGKKHAQTLSETLVIRHSKPS